MLIFFRGTAFIVLYPFTSLPILFFVNFAVLWFLFYNFVLRYILDMSVLVVSVRLII